MSRPFIIAHRGASYDAPENTLISFRRAFADGADGIELDVRLTRDRVPVCIHDTVLNRTAQRNGRVSEIQSAELMRMDAGTWYNRRFPPRADASFAAESIPTLDEALLCCRAAAPRSSIYIEMKCVRGEEERLAEAVCNVVKKSGGDLQIIVASFALAGIRAAKAYLSSLRTAGIFEWKLTQPRPSVSELLYQARDAGADELMLDRRLITRRAAAVVHEHGLPLTIWTVDDPAWAQRAIDYNLRAVITNRPGRMRAALAGLTPDS